MTQKAQGPVKVRCLQKCNQLALMRMAAFSNSRPTQAAASMTAPWDPRPGIRGDGQAAAGNRMHPAHDRLVSMRARPCCQSKYWTVAKAATQFRFRWRFGHGEVLLGMLPSVFASSNATAENESPEITFAQLAEWPVRDRIIVSIGPQLAVYPGYQSLEYGQSQIPTHEAALQHRRHRAC